MCIIKPYFKKTTFENICIYCNNINQAARRKKSSLSQQAAIIPQTACLHRHSYRQWSRAHLCLKGSRPDHCYKNILNIIIE